MPGAPPNLHKLISRAGAAPTYANPGCSLGTSGPENPACQRYPNLHNLVSRVGSAPTYANPGCSVGVACPENPACQGYFQSSRIRLSGRDCTHLCQPWLFNWPWSRESCLPAIVQSSQSRLSCRSRARVCQPWCRCFAYAQ